MRLHAAAVAPPETMTSQPPGELSQIVTWTFAAFVLVSVVVGGVASLIVNDLRWEVWRLALLVGLLPALVVAGLLAFASFRRIWNAVVTLVGVDLDGNGTVGETEAGNDRPLVIVNKYQRPTTEGIDEGDLRDFVRVIYQTHDLTQATWRGRKMVSGRVCSNNYHRDIMAILLRTGVVIEDGKARRLAIEDVETALRLLNL